MMKKCERCGELPSNCPEQPMQPERAEVLAKQMCAMAVTIVQAEDRYGKGAA